MGPGSGDSLPNFRQSQLGSGQRTRSLARSSLRLELLAPLSSSARFELDAGAGRGRDGAMTVTPTRPPSMSSTVPCTNAASLLARSTAACAMSSGVPALVCGCGRGRTPRRRSRRSGAPTRLRDARSSKEQRRYVRCPRLQHCSVSSSKRRSAVPGQHYADEDCRAGLHALGVMRLSECRRMVAGHCRDDGRMIHEATRRCTC
jgi:hypothetical protein